MNLVNDNESHILDKVPCLPRSGDSVPLLWGCHDHRRLRDGSPVRCRVSCQLHNLLTKLLLKPDPPVPDPLSHKSLEGGDVNNFGLWSLPEHPEHRDLSHDGLPGPGGGAQQHVLVGVVQSVEQLCLDRIEVAELEKKLKLGLIEGGDRQGLEIKKVSVRGMSLRKDKMLERDCTAAL